MHSIDQIKKWIFKVQFYFEERTKKFCLMINHACIIDIENWYDCVFFDDFFNDKIVIIVEQFRISYDFECVEICIFVRHNYLAKRTTENKTNHKNKWRIYTINFVAFFSQFFQWEYVYNCNFPKRKTCICFKKPSSLFSRLSKCT